MFGANLDLHANQWNSSCYHVLAQRLYLTAFKFVNEKCIEMLDPKRAITVSKLANYVLEISALPSKPLWLEGHCRMYEPVSSLCCKSNMGPL